MTRGERDALVEQAAGAHRGRDPRDGRILPSPAWLDLDAADRERAFAVAAEGRALEAALDPDGLSTTARAVLARIERQ
jgi:hypothetical protein